MRVAGAAAGEPGLRHSRGVGEVAGGTAGDSGPQTGPDPASHTGSSPHKGTVSSADSPGPCQEGCPPEVFGKDVKNADVVGGAVWTEQRPVPGKPSVNAHHCWFFWEENS